MDKNINVLLYGYGEGMRDEGGINEMLYWFLMLIKLSGKEKKVELVWNCWYWVFIIFFVF